MDYKARQDELLASIRRTTKKLDEAREEQDERKWSKYYDLYVKLWEEYEQVRGR